MFLKLSLNLWIYPVGDWVTHSEYPYCRTFLASWESVHSHRFLHQGSRKVWNPDQTFTDTEVWDFPPLTTKFGQCHFHVSIFQSRVESQSLWNMWQVGLLSKISKAFYWKYLIELIMLRKYVNTSLTSIGKVTLIVFVLHILNLDVGLQYYIHTRFSNFNTQFYLLK